MARPSDLTGGDTGLTGIPALGIGPVVVQGPFKPIVFGYLAWGLALLSVLFNYHLVRSRPGRALRALASSEAGALAAGVPVGRYKLQVFALSAAYAGLAGGVYAFYVSYIAPGSFPLVTLDRVPDHGDRRRARLGVGRGGWRHAGHARGPGAPEPGHFAGHAAARAGGLLVRGLRADPGRRDAGHADGHRARAARHATDRNDGYDVRL